MKWNDANLKTLKQLKIEGLTHNEIAEEMGTTMKSVETAVSRYRNILFSDEAYGKNLLEKRSVIKKNLKLNKENNVILDKIVAENKFADRLEDVFKAITFKTHKATKKKKSKKKINRTIVAHISDTHFGADIQGDEMGGINQYGTTEEARRLAFFVREVANYKIEHRSETDLVIALNADLIQGVIHDIDTTKALTTQFAIALSLLTQAISYLANEFSSVKVICTTGNHGRAMHRPEKGRATRGRFDGYHTMLNIAMEAALANLKNVTFEIPITPYWYGKIRGHNYFILHSDTVLSTGSIGKAINVMAIKNKINDLITGIGPIDVVMAGHTHVPLTTLLANGTRLLCNGNLSGIDEYCLSLGIVNNQPSQQVFEVTDKYAVGDLRNVMVVEADKEKALDKIIEPFTEKF